MALCVTQKLLRNSSRLALSNPATSKVLGLRDIPTERKFERKRRLCKATPSLLLTQTAHFHHQSIIRIYIQTARGILLEALQKSRVSAEDYQDVKVPEELRRLKAGSLKWLFSVWPTPLKSIAGVPTTSDVAIAGEDLSSGGLEPKDGRLPNHLRRSGSRPHANTEQLYAVVDYLKHKNIAIRRLIRLPWLLTSDPVILEMSVERVQQKLNLKDFGVAISFVNLNDSKLIEAGVIWKRDAIELSKRSFGKQVRNRVDYLAYMLKCQKEDASDMIARINKLMTMPLKNIDETLQHLLDGGVKPEGIVSDPWVFIQNLSRIKDRMRVLTENDIQDYKPWVLRCSQRRFEIHIQQELKEKELLAGHLGVRGFLKEKLNSDEERISEMIARVPGIKRASASKLNEMIEFLISAGYTQRQIIENPRILTHSVETISDRLREISSFRYPVTNLQLLCRTSKDYRAIVRKLKSDSSKASEVSKESTGV